MKDEYERFLKWVEQNNIELYEYQKQMIKAFFENRLISIPRQSGRYHGFDLVAKFYELNE